MRFAVLMRKQNLDNPWVSYRWVPREVLPDFGQFNPQSLESNSISGQFLGRDDDGESWLFTGFELNLFPDNISVRGVLPEVLLYLCYRSSLYYF